MKKVLTILMPLLLIAGGLFLLYMFVLQDMIDPPPDKVMEECVEFAQSYVNNSSQASEDAFRGCFSARTQDALQREWSAVMIGDRGSWYELAEGLLTEDLTRPEIVGFTIGAPVAEGEEPAEEEGEPTAATVTLLRNRIEFEIPLVREEGYWRIEYSVHPQALGSDG